MNKIKLNFIPVIDNKKLVSESIYDYINRYIEKNRQDEILVAEIDPNFADGYKLCEMYDIEKSDSFNCLIAECRRGAEKKYCALVVPLGYRCNISDTVKKYTDSKVSIAPLEYVLENTGMEYGSITPIGLPIGWEILVDPILSEKEKIIIGGGLVKSKIMMPVKLFLKMPNVKILENLAKKVEE